jgi:bifunctional non-homologous end joining protein LigD
MALESYKRKRRFNATPEPPGAVSRSNRHRFVVQEHHASRLHFDFRLEMGGVLKSWAVPKGPSLDPRQKRLAVMTEDHPVQYLTFEGHIAEGNYGAGDMRIWDSGHYEVGENADPVAEVAEGRLSFQLFGTKLHGSFNFVRMHGGFGQQDKEQWLLIKAQDEYSDPDWELQTILPISASERSQLSGKGRQSKKVVHKIEAAPDDNSHKRTTRKKSDAVVSLRKAFAARFKSEAVEVQVGEHVVSFTNLRKVLWPDEGYTKRDLLLYYESIAETMLPYLKDRPLVLKRYPNGIAGSSFFQHNVPEAPEFLQTVEVRIEDAREQETIHYALCNNLASLLYLANIGNIAFNPWLSRIEQLDEPDWIVFDLDPGAVGFDEVRRVALLTRDLLNELELQGYPKTSGSRGMHVHVPLAKGHSYQDAALFAERFAKVIQKENPDLVTLERSLKKRERAEVYFDYLQNAQGKTMVAPYSVRAKPGATVATPLQWSEVEKGFDPRAFAIKTMEARLKKGDLFEPVLHPSKQQSLSEASSVLAKRLRRRRR